MTLHIRSLSLSLTLSSDAFARPSKPQPASISLSLHLPSLPDACHTDSIDDTFSYASIVSALTSNLQGQNYTDIDAVGHEIVRLATEGNWPGTCLNVHVLLPKAVLRAEAGLEWSCEFIRQPSPQDQDRDRNVNTDDKSEAEPSKSALSSISSTDDTWTPLHPPLYKIHSIPLTALIGINAYEREQKQPLTIDLALTLLPDTSSPPATPLVTSTPNPLPLPSPFSSLTNQIASTVETSTYLTVEALSHALATKIMHEHEGVVRSVSVKVEKTAIYNLVGGVGFEVVLSREGIEER